MNAHAVAVWLAMLGAALIVGCGPKKVQTAVPSGQSTVVLLPDPGDGHVGRAVVSNNVGATELSAARESTTVAPNRAPAPAVVMNEADVTRLFGDVLTALPAPPQTFLLYFRFESEDLTDESRGLLPQVLQAVKNRPFPDVAVVGHTDTTGTNASNYELGLRRANAIRASLIDAGIDVGLIEVSSHGESDLLVKTADSVAEPRNRRVEITVR